MLNLATGITLARIAGTPWIAHLILIGRYEWAAVGLALAGASDVIDGHVARTFHQVTSFGSFLDPLADKFLVNTSAFALCVNEVLPCELAGVFVCRDALLGAGVAYGALQRRREETVRQDAPCKIGVSTQDRKKIGLLVQPHWSGKLSTFGQLGTIWYGTVLGAMGSVSTDPILEPLCWVVGSVTILSGIVYAHEALRARNVFESSVFRKK